VSWSQGAQTSCCHLLTCAYSEIENIWQRSWRMGFYRGGPVFMSALAGIDIALWDLKGEIRAH
jgi:L-alanine-DL-glutamate epimerase-like enolase superfamily enzyme